MYLLIVSIRLHKCAVTKIFKIVRLCKIEPEKQIKNEIEKKEYEILTPTMDNVTDKMNNAQFLVFIRSVNENFKVHSKSLQMYSLKSATTVKDLFNI